MKERLFSLAKGTGEAFLTVNLLISLLASFSYPSFFHIGLLFRPQVLALTIPLSLAFHFNIKYLRERMQQPENIGEDFEEVNPDLSH